MLRVALEDYAQEKAQEDAEASYLAYADDDYDDYYFGAEYLDLVEAKKINTWEKFKNV